MANSTYIQKESKVLRVSEIQTYLKEWGFPLEPPKPLKVDGIFGSQTDRALREFQGNCGLKVDGVAGEKTCRILSLARNPSVPMLIDTFNRGNISWVMRMQILYKLTTATSSGDDLSKAFDKLDLDKLMPLLIEDIKSEDAELRCLATQALQKIKALREPPSIAPLSDWREAIRRWLKKHCG